MRLFVDAQCLQTSSAPRGIGRYTRGLIQGLAAEADRRGDWTVSAVFGEHLPPPELADWPSTVERIGYRPTQPQPSLLTEPDAVEVMLANDAAFAKWLTAAEPDVWLAGSVFETHTLLPRFAAGAARPAVAAVVYDVIPLLFPGIYLPTHEWRNWYADRLGWLTAADRLLAISGSTADDVASVVGYPPRQIVAIAGAPAESLRPLAAEELAVRLPRLRERFGLVGEYVLYVGGADHRKNLGGAVRALAALPSVPAAGDSRHSQRPLLVIACHLPEPLPRDVAELASQLGVGEQLRLTGFVEDADLAALMQGCRVFFFPSLYEGLGLPVVEALRCGAPVVASSTASLPEFAGPTAWTARPDDPHALAAALSAALAEPRDQRLAERLTWAERFTWTATGRAAAEALAELGSPRRSRHRTKPLPEDRRADPLHPIFGEAIHPERELAGRLARRLLARSASRFRVRSAPSNDARLASLAELNVAATAQPGPTAWLMRTLRSLLRVLVRPWLARQSDFNEAVLAELRRLARLSAEHERTLEHWEDRFADGDHSHTGDDP